MKNFIISQIVDLLANKLTNLKSLATHLHAFTYKELNGIADMLVSDLEEDHARAESMINSRIAINVLSAQQLS